MHPKLIFKGDFQIRTYDIDSRKQATIPALIQLMQEAAMQNVIDINLSIWDMEKTGISWVIMRMNLIVKRLPVLGEIITVITHGSGFEKFFTYRDYRVMDQKGELIAYAPSTWLLMDTHTRKMTRIPQYILDYETPPLDKCLPRINNKLSKFETGDRVKYFKVNYHDLDFNDHLNNTTYIKWMLETLEDKNLVKGKLLELDIQYRHEGHWHDEIQSEVQMINENTFMHRLSRVSNGQELAIAKSSWESE